MRSLFGDRVDALDVRRDTVEVDHFDTPTAFLDFFKASYGPTIVAYRGLADDPARTESLDRELVALADQFDRGTASTVMDWEYLLVTARTRT